MWKIAQAIARGVSHIESDLPCQDECYAESLCINGEDCFIAIVADGAGSALRGERGANLACTGLFNIIKKTIEEKHTSRITHDDVKLFVLKTKEILINEANRENLRTRDYACTLLCSIVSNGNSIFFQVGDGAIVASKKNIFGIVFLPDNGEYPNMTNFITQEDVLDRLSIEIMDDGNFSSISMFTDGIQNVALNLSQMMPHIPFFKPMLDTLSKYSDFHEIDFDSKLLQFLQSENINARTDDDKTLILAVKTS